MKIIFQIIKGICLGAGAVLPGISSGVLCVVFGIYETLINSILNFLHDIRKNLKFLLPLIIGILIGVCLFGNILKYTFQHFSTLARFCFIGLILGSMPSILKETNVKKIKPTYFLILLLTFSFSIYLISLEFSSHNTLLNNSSTFIGLVLSGFAMSFGVIIPGISSTVILMLVGKYSLYLCAISTLDLQILVPMGIGLCIGGIFLLILMKFLFAHFRDMTYFSIIGFTLGSIFVLFPTHALTVIEYLIGFIGLIICLFIALVISNYKHSSSN